MNWKDCVFSKSMWLTCAVLFAQTVTAQQSPTAETPRLTAEQRQQVAAIRQHALDVIDAINSMLSASSFAARTEAYCHFYVDHAPSILPGINSEKQAAKRYAELLRSKPTTRDEELRRQYQLRAIRDWLEAFAEQVNTCRRMVLNGLLKLPDTDELRKHLADERAAVAKADSMVKTH